MKFLSLTLSVAALALGIAFAPALNAADDPVVAKVNGEVITLSELVAVQQTLPEQYKSVPLASLYNDLLNSEINSRLTIADALSRKMDAEKKFADQLAKVKLQLLQRYIIQKEITNGITEEALQTKYMALIEPMKGQKEVKASHILVKTEDEAKAIIAELDKGADFAILAKDKSTGPSAPNGGDLGFFAKGQMVPEFQEAAFALKKDAYTKSAVKTQFGFHVIKVTDMRNIVVPTREQAMEQLRAELSREIGQNYIEGLRKTATIETFNQDGTPKK